MKENVFETTIFDRYLFRMDQQALYEREIAKGVLKPIPFFADRVIHVIFESTKLLFTDVFRRVQRMAVFTFATLSLIPHVVFLPLSLTACVSYKFKENKVSDFMSKYGKHLFNHLKFMVELIPSMISPLIRPTALANHRESLAYQHRSLNASEAIELFKSAPSEKNCLEAVYLLLKENRPMEAYDLFKPYAERDAKSMLMMANDICALIKDKAGERKHYLQKALELGSSKAALWLAKVHEKEKDSKKCEEYIQLAINRGDSHAKFYQAIYNLNTPGKEKEGLAQLKKIADEGKDFSEKAHYELSRLYETGFVGALPRSKSDFLNIVKLVFQYRFPLVKSNPLKTIEHCQKIASGTLKDKKSSKLYTDYVLKAYETLAHHYYHGIGVKEDKKEANKYIHLWQARQA